MQHRQTHFSIDGNQGIKAEIAIQAARIGQHPDRRACKRRSLTAPLNIRVFDDRRVGCFAEKGQIARCE
jgi:hypothetical protein